MYRSALGFGGWYPRGYLAAGIGFPYMGGIACPYWGGYGYPGCGWGYGYPGYGYY